MTGKSRRVLLYIPAEGRIVVQGFTTTLPSIGEHLSCKGRQYRIAGVHPANHTVVLTLNAAVRPQALA